MKTIYFNKSQITNPATSKTQFQEVTLCNKQDIKLKNVYNPVEGDIIHIDAYCKIPRFKLKEFCEEHKVKITRDKNKANIRFANNDSLNNYIIDTYSSTILLKKSSLIYFLKKQGLPSKFGDLINILQSYDYEYFFTDYNFVHSAMHGYGFQSKLDFKCKTDYDDENNPVNHIDYIDNDDDDKRIPIKTEMYDEYVNFINESYDEKALLSLLNKSFVIDKEAFEGISNLFESSDNGNHILAMETMANCSYNESAVYLLLLFKEYKQQIYNSKTRHHVNFKSLTNYFNISVGSYLHFDEIFQTLIKLNLINEQNVQVLKEKIWLEANDSFITQYFVYSDIEPTDDIKQLINANNIIIKAEETII